MHGEKVMAKKTKSSGKGESETLDNEKAIEVNEETIPSGADADRMDAVRILMIIGGLFFIFFLGFLILRQVLHIL